MVTNLTERLRKRNSQGKRSTRKKNNMSDWTKRLALRGFMKQRSKGHRLALRNQRHPAGKKRSCLSDVSWSLFSFRFSRAL